MEKVHWSLIKLFHYLKRMAFFLPQYQMVANEVSASLNVLIKLQRSERRKQHTVNNNNYYQ